jgi:hypothetical protein
MHLLEQLAHLLSGPQGIQGSQTPRPQATAGGNLLQGLGQVGGNINVGARPQANMQMQGGSPQGFPDRNLGGDYDGGVANSLMLAQPVSQQFLQPSVRPGQYQGPQAMGGGQIGFPGAPQQQPMSLYGGFQGNAEAGYPQPNMQQSYTPQMQGLQNPGATPGQGGYGVSNIQGGRRSPNISF